MCSALSLQYHEFTDALIEQYSLKSNIVRRTEEAEKEIRFSYRDAIPRLPIIRGSLIEVVLWGNRDDKRSKLPHTGWCRNESLVEGKWKWLHPEIVDIPAAMICEKGVWLQVAEGIRGVLVHDEHGLSHAYVLTEPASHYFEVATRHDRMPVTIGPSF